MPRAFWGKLSPWIENLILCYGSQEGSSGGRLKAHVIGVGQMSQSQAQGSDGPTGLLFLSDGVLQIPAVLTASAWEHLQDQEDRESFTSLLNTTVCIQDYRLQFHMAQEQTKCRFFLLVGELATTAAGPVKDKTPCCTTLLSIRLKICKTWRVLLAEEVQDSQASQCGFDLSELLGEWQHDCLQDVVDDVKERLMTIYSRSVSPQPSTSTCIPLPTHPDTSTTTSWDVDRVTYKGEESFTVPVKCLLIPEEDALQLQSVPNVGSRTQNELSAASEDRKIDLLQVDQPSESAQPSADETEPAVEETDHDAISYSPLSLQDGIRPLSNPWDIFPPPCESSSSSDASPVAEPIHLLHSPTNAASKPDHSGIITSTQLPTHSSKESWHTSEMSEEGQSFLPPYQRPPHSSGLPITVDPSTSTSVSTPEPFTRPSNKLTTTENLCTDTPQQKLPPLDQDSQSLERVMEEAAEKKCSEAKKERSEPPSGALTALVDEGKEASQIGGSPPSWLFETLTSSGSQEDSFHQDAQTATAVSRRSPSVHSDGKPFSYSYRVSGQNLQDFSHFKVAGPWLNWAVKYLLVPKQNDVPHSKSVTSSQMPSDGT